MRRERHTSLRRLAAEAAANTLARPALSLGLTLAIAAMITGATLAEINSTTDVRNYERELIDTGWATLLVEQDNPAGNTLPTETCGTLAAIEGVAASAAMREPEPFTLWSGGGPYVPVRAVSADIIDFLRAADSSTVGGPDIAQALVDIDALVASPSNTSFPLRLVDQGGTSYDTTARTVALTALGAGSSGNIVTIDPTPGPVAACALYVATSRRDHVNRSIDTALPVLDGFSQRWALPSAEQFDTPQYRFEHRPSQYYWAITTLAFIAIALLHLRLRRSDHALYAIAGLDRQRVWTLAALELAAILATAFALAALTTGLAVRRHDLPAGISDVGWTSLARTLIATALVTLTLTRAAASRTTTSTLDAIKDR